MMCTTIRRGEERAVGQRQILCRVVVVIRIIRAGRTRKTAVLIQKISQSFSPRKRDERDEREREREGERERETERDETRLEVGERERETRKRERDESERG